MLMCALEKDAIEDLNSRVGNIEIVGVEKSALERCTKLPETFVDDYGSTSKKPVATDEKFRIYHQIKYLGGRAVCHDRP